MANGSLITTLDLCSAAAVASEQREDATKTPWFQSNASYTSGTPSGLLPPKMMAEIGTPLGLSHSGSIMGQFLLGAQNLEFGCAAFVEPLGFQFDSLNHDVTLMLSKETSSSRPNEKMQPSKPLNNTSQLYFLQFSQSTVLQVFNMNKF